MYSHVENCFPTKAACLILNFAEVPTEAGSDSNLRLVENHYPAPSAPPLQTDQLTPSTPPATVPDSPASSPMQVQVGISLDITSSVKPKISKHSYQ